MNEPTTLPALPETFVVPVTGEVLNLNVPADVARALAFVRSARAQLNDARKVLEDVLLEESKRMGTKTLRFGDTTATVAGGPETNYHIDVLLELTEAGLPEERWAELVTTKVDYKVNASVAKQLAASNEVYAEIIDRARFTVDKPRRVDVKGA